MEWFAWLAPVPVTAVPAASPADVLRFDSATDLLSVVALLVALVPALLAMRHRFGQRNAATDVARLRLVEGGKELGRRAA